MSKAAMSRQQEGPEQQQEHVDDAPAPGPYPRCPSCGWQNVRFAKSHIFDHVLALVNVHPFRCRSCRCRFYRFFRRPAEQ